LGYPICKDTQKKIAKFNQIKKVVEKDIAKELKGGITLHDYLKDNFGKENVAVVK